MALDHTQGIITHLAYTYQQPDGNRLVAGQASVPEAQPLDIPLANRPQWLTAAPLGEGSVWVAVLIDGQVQAFYVTEQVAESIPITPAQLPPGMPPLLAIEDSFPRLILSPDADASLLTHPLVLAPSRDNLAFITNSGDIVIHRQDEITRLSIDAPTDARILQDEMERLLLLANSTTRYSHGILGDDIEAESVVLIEIGETPRVVSQISIPAPGVIEGLMPLWADLSGDGQREIIVTISDAEQGSQIVTYDEEGNELARGPAVGQGFRWRHQLAIAPFGPNGEIELADVLTPHIGGIVEFYQLAEGRLEVVATVPGYSTHSIGSRNLDAALAGDLDGDSHTELLVPDQSHTQLGAIRRTTDGAEVIWTVPIGGQLSTNIAAVSFADGSAAIGVGHDGNSLRLWLPQR